MASIYMLSLDGERYLGLDATTEIRVTRSGEATTNTIQDGSDISDNYHSGLPKISFSGIISNAKLRDTTPTVSEYVDFVNELMDSRVYFTLYSTVSHINQKAIPTFSKCVISNFAYVRGGGKDESLEISLAIQQLDISKKAKQGRIPAKKDEGLTVPTEDKGTGGKTEVDTAGLTRLKAISEGKSSSMLLDFINTVESVGD